MNTLLLIGGIGMQEILVIALIVLLLFGGKKIPELLKGIGKGARSINYGVNGIEKEVESNDGPNLANSQENVQTNGIVGRTTPLNVVGSISTPSDPVHSENYCSLWSCVALRSFS